MSHCGRCFSAPTYDIPVIVLSNTILQQSELHVTFPFQPEENTAIWAAISGNAIQPLVCVHEYSPSESGPGPEPVAQTGCTALLKDTAACFLNGKWVDRYEKGNTIH